MLGTAMMAQFLFEGRRKDFACDSLSVLKSGRWPSDTKRVTMISKEPYYVSIIIDNGKIEDNIAIVRGSDSSWVKLSMKTIEDIFDDVKTLWSLLLHPVTVGILSCFFTFVGVNFLLLKLFHVNLLSFWSNPIGALVAAIVVLGIGTTIIYEWVARVVRFLVPYADFEWNASKLQKFLRPAVGLVLSSVVGGALYGILMSII
jgi:hypothetical protein